jgi:hypothetical protein
MVNVRIYFYQLYNATNGKFRTWLESVGNEDAVTGNRMFDRHEAVTMIKEAAASNKDAATSTAKAGDVYHCVVILLRENGLSLKLRRADYKRLTHHTTAEAA